MFNLISLIKNNRTSMSSCIFSQNMGDSVLVLGCRMHMERVSPHRAVWMEQEASALQISVKSFLSGSSARAPAFPYSRTLSSGSLPLALLTAIVLSEPAQV